MLAGSKSVALQTSPSAGGLVARSSSRPGWCSSVEAGCTVGSAGASYVRGRRQQQPRRPHGGKKQVLGCGKRKQPPGVMWWLNVPLWWLIVVKLIYNQRSDSTDLLQATHIYLTGVELFKLFKVEVVGAM